MEFRLNIVFSVIFHLTIIVIAIPCFNIYTSRHVPASYMVVSFFREITDLSAVTSGGKEDEITSDSKRPRHHARSVNKSPYQEEERSLPSASNDYLGEETIINAGNEINIGDSTSSANQHESVEEANRLQANSGDKTKGPLPSFSKEGTAGFGEQNTAAQDAGNLYALIRAAIEKMKIYPMLARKKKIEGTVTAGFFINHNGYPDNVKIKKSSGYEILDSAAVKIVMKAAPFPQAKGEIIVPITFRLTEPVLSYRR